MELFWYDARMCHTGFVLEKKWATPRHYGDRKSGRVLRRPAMSDVSARHQALFLNHIKVKEDGCCVVKGNEVCGKFFETCKLQSKEHAPVICIQLSDANTCHNNLGVGPLFCLSLIPKCWILSWLAMVYSAIVTYLLISSDSFLICWCAVGCFSVSGLSFSYPVTYRVFLFLSDSHVSPSESSGSFFAHSLFMPSRQRLRRLSTHC